LVGVSFFRSYLLRGRLHGISPSNRVLGDVIYDRRIYWRAGFAPIAFGARRCQVCRFIRATQRHWHDVIDRQFNLWRAAAAVPALMVVTAQDLVSQPLAYCH
jgi:hypothetical protein